MLHQENDLSPNQELTRRWILPLILIVFVVLGTIYSIVTPLFETPDEIWHYLYVKHFADGGDLPVYHEGTTFPMRQEASQPPLYYVLNGWATAWIDTSDADIVTQYNPHAAIGAPSAWGNRNVMSHTSYEDFPYRGTVLAAHLARFLSVLMGAGTVLCTYAIARRLFPQPDWLAPAAAALNAFVPQFIFISASINNDVLTTCLSALSLWLLVCIVQDGASLTRLAVLGVILGLASLTKLNALVLMPLAALVLIVLAWRRGSRWAFVRWGAWTFAAASIVGAWWYVRNWLLYGDPFGLRLMFAVMPVRPERPTFPELLHLLDGALKSFWGVFGWFNVVMDPGAYTAFDMGLVFALAGLARILYRHLVRRDWEELLDVGVLSLWGATFVAALVGWTQARYPQGRLLFPAMPAIATLIVLGLAQWLPSRGARFIMAGLLLTLLCFAAIVPYLYIEPAYARAQSLTATERSAITHPLPVEYGERVQLLGYDLSKETIEPGSRLWVTLYWETMAAMDRDYSVFVHLVDERGVTIAQRDSYPGAGNNPTRDWIAGQSIRDVHPVYVPPTLLAAPPFRVRVGLYDYATSSRLPIDNSPTGANALDLPTELGLEGEADGLHELRFEFGERIALTGFSVEPLVAQPGDTLHVTLRWQALHALDDAYTVMVQLVREGTQIWGQNDHVPSGGQSPTDTWTAEQVVTDKFELAISPDAPKDSYDLVVGIYHSATIKRLKLPDGTDFVVLGKVEVEGR